MKNRTAFFACLLALLIFKGLAIAATEGMLTVKTDPEGVEVWVDDKYIGDAPIIAKKISPGRYTLKLVDPVGHSSAAEEIFIENGQTTTIEKAIKTKYGSLKVTTDPPGAQVYLLTQLGQTPLNNDFIIPGKYRLEVTPSSPGYKTVTADVVIPKGETVTLNKILERKTIFDTKALARIALGVGAIAFYGWAISAQGDYRYYSHIPMAVDPTAVDKSNSAAAQRTWGIILGTTCVLGFEIVAFF
ncbi:MAG: PEGA domain-containing protein [Chitinivibrionales bacterium]|nr:PEGA domain-containing protein [Chitinivibrionales bacterium]